VNLIQDYTYIYACFFRHHPNEKIIINNKKKQQQAKNRQKNHGKMNIKRNTNTWTYILSKDREEKRKKRIHIL
jgi:hypothetical protein